MTYLASSASLMTTTGCAPEKYCTSTSTPVTLLAITRHLQQGLQLIFHALRICAKQDI